MTYTRLSRPRRTPDFNRGATWLASANREPGSAIERWRAGQLADIETGQLLNVVRVDGVDRGVAALKDLWQSDVPVGPVLHNRADSCIEFLVSTRAGAGWDMPYTHLIGRSTDEAQPRTVPMPAPGMHRVSGRIWLILPDGERRPTDLRDLAVALRHADARLRHGTS
ncbi:hypothetical protein ACIQI7_09030 [Kitasatospora sp. NPDC092039]|uniref:hypothetical protein n=1 Tax=Kitasatospora sp. NPDC092039 TaxID=3364086 RepID=UPI00380295EA